MMRPINVLSGTSVLADIPNTAPVFSTLPDRQDPLGELVHSDMFSANDADGDALTYQATGLPPGLHWTIGDEPVAVAKKSGYFSLWTTLLLIAAFVARRDRSAV